MSKKCLIIDDVNVSRFVLREFLEELGYQVAEAADSEEAMSIAETEKFDAIFMDLHLR